MKNQKIFSVETPKTKEVARMRQLIAAGASVLALVGVGSAAKAALTDEKPRPTRPVQVQYGDTVDKYAYTVARQMGDDVDYRDVRNDIINASPAAQDGIINPGDVLNVPMTDKQIAERQAQDN